MSTTEQRTLLEGVRQLVANGRHFHWAELHRQDNNFDQAHDYPAFLGWHRAFIFEYESDLRALGGRFACLALPYWDWSMDAQGGAGSLGSIFNDNNGLGTLRDGCIVSGPFRNIRWPRGGSCVRRGPDYNLQLFGLMQQGTVLRLANSQMFSRAVETGGHTSAHNAIGGDMSSADSAADFVFYMIHANTDRLWAMWQDCYDFDEVSPNQLRNIQYHGDPDERFRGMQQYTMRRVWNIERMAYGYDTADLWSNLGSGYGHCNWDSFRLQRSFTAPAADVPSSVLEHVGSMKRTFDAEYAKTRNETLAMDQALQEECEMFNLDYNLESSLRFLGIRARGREEEIEVENPCNRFKTLLA